MVLYIFFIKSAVTLNKLISQINCKSKYKYFVTFYNLGRNEDEIKGILPIDLQRFEQGLVEPQL